MDIWRIPFDVRACMCTGRAFSFLINQTGRTDDNWTWTYACVYRVNYARYKTWTMNEDFLPELHIDINLNALRVHRFCACSHLT